MTVSTTKASDVFPGNGSAGPFDCEWRIFDDTDVIVSLVDQETGTDTPLVLNTDYTISGAGDQAGFTVATTSPVESGTSLYIRRSIGYQQPTDFTNQGAFFPTMHEDAMDRLEMQIQQQVDTLVRAMVANAITGHYSALNHRLADLSDAVDFGDATNLGQVEQLIASAQINPSTPAADIALYSHLASTAAGRGAALVGYGTGSVKDKLDALDAANTALAGDSGAGQVGFKSSLSGAIKITLAQALNGAEIHSSWFGADSTGSTSASTALQAALNVAGGRTLVVDPGTYKITSPLKIKSNTRIVMYGATLIRGAAIDNLLRNDADGTTGVYAANSNIQIFGGTLDGAATTYSGTSATLLAFGHCTGVTVKDATLQNTAGYHYIEFNASTRCLVDGCLFSGGAEQASSTMEAVQIDAAISSGQFPWFGPYDNTPCNGVVIRNSIFNSCGSGVGTHTDPASQHVNISILGCSFTGTYYAAVRGQGWSGVIIANSRINGGHFGIFQAPTSTFSCNNLVITGNTIENMGDSGYNPGAGALGRAINIGSVSGKVINIISVTGNTVRNCSGTYAQHGIYLNAATKFNVIGNVIDTVNTNGLYIDGCSYGTVGYNESALSGGIELVCSGSCVEVVVKDNRAARATISGNSKIYYAHNIIGTSQTLGTNTSSITTPNLVNGVNT